MSTIAKQNYRGRYHFSPKKNWMNDPNGLVYYEGEYHLFFQHHPQGMTWGPMHWGHAVSKDLIHWEELDIALAPDENGTIFSGSAVVDWQDTTGFFGGKAGLVAIFTHNDEAEGRTSVQAQSLAYSLDKGRTWTKYAGNPVLTHETYIDFRDPKVFWHEDTRRWIMIVACGQTVCLFHSPNLIDWTFGSEFGTGIGFHGGVWECPDLFSLRVDGDAAREKWVMLVSVGDNPDYIEGSRTQYFTGEFDGVTFTPDADSHAVRWLDHGRDNYAAVSWSDIPEEDGRRIIVGWMSNWKYANLTPSEEFRGAMTVPRELTLETREGIVSLVQKPVKELEQSRTPILTLSDVSRQEAENTLSSLRLESYELIAVAESNFSYAFQLRSGSHDQTVVGIDPVQGKVYVDRKNAGQHKFHEQFRGVHTAALNSLGDELKLRILVDRCSVEVFANDGLAVITDLVYPAAESTGLGLIAEDESLRFKSLKIYKLK